MIEIHRRNTLPVPHEYSKAASLSETAENLIDQINMHRVIDIVDSEVRGGWRPGDDTTPLSVILRVLCGGEDRIEPTVDEAYEVLAAAAMLVCAVEARASIGRLVDCIERHGGLAKLLRETDTEEFIN